MNKFLNVYNNVGQPSQVHETLRHALEWVHNGTSCFNKNYMYTIEYNDHGIVHIHRPPMEEGYYEVVNITNSDRLILYYRNGKFSYHKEDYRNKWDADHYKIIRKLNI